MFYYAHCCVGLHYLYYCSGLRWFVIYGPVRILADFGISVIHFSHRRALKLNICAHEKLLSLCFQRGCISGNNCGECSVPFACASFITIAHMANNNSMTTKIENLFLLILVVIRTGVVIWPT